MCVRKMGKPEDAGMDKMSKTGSTRKTEKPGKAQYTRDMTVQRRKRHVPS